MQISDIAANTRLQTNREQHSCRLTTKYPPQIYRFKLLVIQWFFSYQSVRTPEGEA